MYVDQTDLIVSFCVSDVAFLKQLNHDVLSLGLGAKLGVSLNKLISSPNAGVVNVEADLTDFAESFESAILALDKLTMHQTEKLKEVLKRDHVHLKAPAGAGKTFVALHCILLALFGANGTEAAEIKILFVVKNEALALFVVKWLCARLENLAQRRKMLKRLHLLYQPCTDGPRAVELTNGRLSTKKAEPAEMYDLVAIDEAHEVHPQPQNPP